MASPAFGAMFHPYPAGLPDPDLPAQYAETAEALGFDSLWVGDHILWRTPFLEPLTLLAVFAARTKRMRLGTGVLLLPLRQPAVVAKTVSTLDYLSRGRIIVGVGVGGENPKEFAVCGVPVNERGRRTDEGIEILRRLWREGDASYEGRFSRFEAIDMQPKPTQLPSPPIWIGGRSAPALHRAACLGDGWIDYFVTPQQFRDCTAKIHEFAAAAGRDLRSFATAHVMLVHLAATKEEARQAAEEYLCNYYGHAFRFLISRYCAFGTPDDCIAKIKGYLAAGAQHMILGPACGPDRMVDQLKTLANEVLPAFR